MITEHQQAKIPDTGTAILGLSISHLCRLVIAMHFSKTYAQLLLSLPPELRENAIQYRQVSFSLTDNANAYHLHTS